VPRIWPCSGGKVSVLGFRLSHVGLFRRARDSCLFFGDFGEFSAVPRGNMCREGASRANLMGLTRASSSEGVENQKFDQYDFLI
jgi:hypothetical protein